MTKKHTHEEYATKKALESNFWFLSILIIVVFVLGIFFAWSMDNNKTLTQLAEAEGVLVLNISEWKIECVEEEITTKYITTCYGFFENKELECSTRTENHTECIYAIRRHE